MESLVHASTASAKNLELLVTKPQDNSSVALSRYHQVESRWWGFVRTDQGFPEGNLVFHSLYTVKVVAEYRSRACQMQHHVQECPCLL
jgi:hypothetical protein